MDTSKTYIKMCEKAVEIQEAWDIKSWDFVYCKEDKETVVLSDYETDGGFYGHECVSYPWLHKIEPYIIGCGSKGLRVFCKTIRVECKIKIF